MAEEVRNEEVGWRKTGRQVVERIEVTVVAPEKQGRYDECAQREEEGREAGNVGDEETAKGGGEEERSVRGHDLRAEVPRHIS